MRVSVLGDERLQATILLLQKADKELRHEIYRRARTAILPEWNEAIATRVGAVSNQNFTRRLLENTRVKTATDRIGVEAATKTKATVSGGLIPATNFYLAEFGATPKAAQIKGRRGTTQYNYTRKVNTWSDGRRRNGRVAYPVAQLIFKRVLRMWVQTTVRTYYDAFDGKL